MKRLIIPAICALLGASLTVAIAQQGSPNYLGTIFVGQKNTPNELKINSDGSINVVAQQTTTTPPPVSTIGKLFHFNTIAGSPGSTFAITDIAGSDEMILMVTGTTAATITTPTAAQIIAAVPGWAIGDTYRFRLANPTNGVVTIAPGSGVTVTGLTTTASNKWREWLVRYTAAGAVNFRDVGSGND